MNLNMAVLLRFIFVAFYNGTNVLSGGGEQCTYHKDSSNTCGKNFFKFSI